MAYNEKLDSQIAALVAGWSHVDRKKMFGGVCHLMNGNMFCGVYKDFLILRLGTEAAATALRKAGVRPFDITGRPMPGWVMVEESGFKGDKLTKWLEQARAFVQTLPPK
ncbi:MAG: TfoX/Sxy family protein [Deltaproteobacteria bacterium]|nr:TfoX/Sxy family protein [Deltaproteobacteria bacterium]